MRLSAVPRSEQRSSEMSTPGRSGAASSSRGRAPDLRRRSRTTSLSTPSRGGDRDTPSSGAGRRAARCRAEALFLDRRRWHRPGSVTLPAVSPMPRVRTLESRHDASKPAPDDETHLTCRLRRDFERRPSPSPSPGARGDPRFLTQVRARSGGSRRGRSLPSRSRRMRFDGQAAARDRPAPVPLLGSYDLAAGKPGEVARDTARLDAAAVGREMVDGEVQPASVEILARPAGCSSAGTRRRGRPREPSPRHLSDAPKTTSGQAPERTTHTSAVDDEILNVA